jgi:hypothetical protein
MKTQRRITPLLVLTLFVSSTIATVEASAARKSVTQLRRGLFCRDLRRMGYPYGDALKYWNYWGQPDNMDADLNGIPCETVYPAADVKKYFPNFRSR